MTSTTQRMSTTKLLSIVSSIISSSSGHAVTSNRPFARRFHGVHEFILPQQPTTTSTIATTIFFPPEEEIRNASLFPSKSMTYDLGVGKNPPVYGTTSSPAVFLFVGVSSTEDETGVVLLPHANKQDDISAMTQYLVEHKAVREYPSPITKDGSQGQKRPSPKVELKRRSEDSLRILVEPASEAVEKRNQIKGAFDPNASTDHVPLIHVTSDTQLDVNTIWVEMMIHNEQMKLSAR